MAVRDAAFDGATAAIRFGAISIPCTTIESPKEEGKEEKIREIGNQLATVRTVGVWDVANASVEMLSTRFVKLLLPRIPKHGANLFEFPITVLQRHPIVSGPYSHIWDRCRIFGLEQTIEASEKAHKVKIPLSVIEVFHRGEDGVWKSLAWKPTLGTPQAQAFMF